ncbi:hypothetical protein TSUD_59970 [Trifolium subterraneum]|uniref:Replication protein A 70 kDa DNA-binding subunit B/D first OB fold domain-containing protein n=1 Tax=Trifolium subterraneum TaxID=3900 RepID=A0A2Z6N5M3_TRISU|nr:hypothetical protein TSUD_59970 [Trifolium subterraneum]
MTSSVTSLSCLRTRKLNWCIRVRVVKRWIGSKLGIRGNVTSVGLVLLDEEGNKIEASVPSDCVDYLGPVLVEDGVSTIRHYALTLFSSEDVSNYKYGLSNLVDVIGFLTSLKYDHVNDNLKGVSDVVKFELSDSRGKFHCMLGGNFVEMFRKLFSKSIVGLPVIVMQFVKINIVEGVVCVQDVENISTVLLNPPIVEVVQFKLMLSLGGCVSPIVGGGESSVPGVTDAYQFNGHTVQIAVGDGKSVAVFQMFDHLLAGINALNYRVLGRNFALGPIGCEILKDREILLIVKKIHRLDDLGDDFVEIVRMTDDQQLIKQYYLDGKNFTPTKSIVKAGFVNVSPHLNNNGLISCLKEDVAAGNRPTEDDPMQFLLDCSKGGHEQNMLDLSLKSGANVNVFSDVAECCSSNMKE